MLQQYLPFTVLKFNAKRACVKAVQLQQYLPFTVLKFVVLNYLKTKLLVATVLTVYGIEILVYVLY